MTELVGNARPLKIRGWAQSEAGSGMYRVDLPLWALRAIGHDAPSFVGIDLAPPGTDAVLGQTIADEVRLAAWRELRERPGRRPVLIAELDDDIWNVDRSNVLAQALTDDAVRGHIEEALRLADAVTVTTEHLAHVVSRFNENVYVLPNCIDLGILMHQRPTPQRITIGWTVSSSHAMDVVEISPTLSHFLRKHPEVDLHLVGQDFRELIKAPNVRWTSWNPELNGYLRSVDFHIGLAPLLPHAFNRARSDIKAVEYAALGIPVVASDFGPYPGSIIHGETGFLVKHPHEWATYLNTLINDAAKRQLMSANARLWASNRTVQGNAWRWELVFRETIARVHGGDIPGLLAPVPRQLVTS